MPRSTAGDTPAQLPEVAYAAGLAGLPGMGPAALARMLSAATPSAAWTAVLNGEVETAAHGAARTLLPMEVGAGQVPRRTDRWAGAARGTDLERLWEACRRGQIHVTYLGAHGYPPRLAADPQPPGVIFWRGGLGGLEAPTVAIIGTRRCTPDGRATAFELGRDLADAGIGVVSGLALGIDGAAHLGALQAGGGVPVGIAASGVDVPYPRRHAELWQDVVARGAVISEAPPGAPAQAWRFPSRNRVIAALADLVVLVESHASGGSLITAEAALARGRDVLAVPGPVHSPASAGTNQLLCDGAGPVRHAEDVLDCLGILRDRPPGSGDHARRRSRVMSRPSGARPPAAAPAGGQRTPGAPTVDRSLETRPVPMENEDTPEPRPGVGARGAGARPASAGGRPATGGSPLPAGGEEPAVGEDARAVLDSVGWQPTSLSVIVERVGSGVGPASRTLAGLEDAGLVRCDAGWWTRTPGSGRE